MKIKLSSYLIVWERNMKCSTLPCYPNPSFPHLINLLLLYRGMICVLKGTRMKKKKKQIRIWPSLLNVIEEEGDSIVEVATMDILSPFTGEDLLLQIFLLIPLVVDTVPSQSIQTSLVHKTTVVEHHLKELPFTLIQISNPRNLKPNARYVIG
jgi:hypothetical protein